MGQREVLRYLARLWEEARVRSAVVHEWDIFERVCVAMVHDRPRNVRFPGRDSPAAIVKQVRHTPAGGNRQFSFPTVDSIRPVIRRSYVLLCGDWRAHHLVLIRWINISLLAIRSGSREKSML